MKTYRMRVPTGVLQFEGRDYNRTQIHELLRIKAVELGYYSDSSMTDDYTHHPTYVLYADGSHCPHSQGIYDIHSLYAEITWLNFLKLEPDDVKYFNPSQETIEAGEGFIKDLKSGDIPNDHYDIEHPQVFNRAGFGETGFITQKEHDVLTHLAKAYRVFTELEVQHPDDSRDFINALHTCQQLIAVRVARKAAPDMFPTILSE